MTDKRARKIQRNIHFVSIAHQRPQHLEFQLMALAGSTVDPNDVTA